MKFYESVFKGQIKQKADSNLLPVLPNKMQSKLSSQQRQHPFTSNFRADKPQTKSTDPLRQSVFLKSKQGQQQQGWFKKLCACTQLQYYKDYFKVTSKDVRRRILCNLMFWKGKFFEPADQDYDFYGPFWIYTTIVFCLGAVHNILQYQGNRLFDYNYEILGEAFFALYVLGFGLSVGIAFIMKALGINNTVFQILCLYGYSTCIYVICIILCSVNICLLHWIFLGYAAANKFYFVFKNIHEGFEVPVAKKLILTVIIAIEVALQFLLFKVRFIYCVDTVNAKISEQSHLFSENSFVHYRSFEDIIPQF